MFVPSKKILRREGNGEILTYLPSLGSLRRLNLISLGKVVNFSSSGSIIIRGGMTPRIGQLICGRKGEPIGKVIKVTGPVGSPYVIINPVIKEEASLHRLAGRPVFIDERPPPRQDERRSRGGEFQRERSGPGRSYHSKGGHPSGREPGRSDRSKDRYQSGKVSGRSYHSKGGHQSGKVSGRSHHSKDRYRPERESGRSYHSKDRYQPERGGKGTGSGKRPNKSRGRPKRS